MPPQASPQAPGHQQRWKHPQPAQGHPAGRPQPQSSPSNSSEGASSRTQPRPWRRWKPAVPASPRRYGKVCMAMRGATRPHTAAHTRAAGAEAASSARPPTRSSTTCNRACTPLAPTRLSSMASRQRCGPAARPSAVSIAPSRCRPPLNAIPRAIPRASTSGIWANGPAGANPSHSNASAAPITAPTQGAKRAMRSSRGVIPGGRGNTL